MPAITVAKYQTITTLYANAQTQVANVAAYYYDAAYEIVTLTVFDPELDLLAPFYNAYLAANTVFAQAPQAVVTATNRLQAHILDKARTDPDIDPNVAVGATVGLRFNNINQWIDASGANELASEGSNTLHENVGRQDDVDTAITVPQKFATLSAQAGFVIYDFNIA